MTKKILIFALLALPIYFLREYLYISHDPKQELFLVSDGLDTVLLTQDQMAQMLIKSFQ